MAAKRRAVYPLKTLLADEGLRAHLVELARNLRAGNAGLPLVLVLPSPRRWLALAQEQGAPGETGEADEEAIDSASVYIADFLRAFGDCGVDAMLLLDEQESAESEPASRGRRCSLLPGRIQCCGALPLGHRLALAGGGELRRRRTLVLRDRAQAGAPRRVRRAARCPRISGERRRRPSVRKAASSTRKYRPRPSPKAVLERLALRGEPWPTTQRADVRLQDGASVLLYRELAVAGRSDRAGAGRHPQHLLHHWAARCAGRASRAGCGRWAATGSPCAATAWACWTCAAPSRPAKAP